LSETRQYTESQQDSKEENCSAIAQAHEDESGVDVTSEPSIVEVYTDTLPPEPKVEEMPLDMLNDEPKAPSTSPRSE
jgi:hypothetical protein